MSDAPKITDAERAQLKAQLDALDEATMEIAAAMEPFRKALNALQGVREGLLERYGVEVAGICEGCERLLVAGDKGHHCVEGEILCEACAPNWTNLREERIDCAAPTDDPEELAERKAIEANIEAHLAAGGSLEDKVLHEL